ncbi:MAG: flagellar basal-body MS-ring/collar protein FliF [Gammaproteobacteria bacterium]|nr:flagellar basal-body MS-ring/collar protein FliF [Gammaproteobacteria bacterium]
MALDSQEVLGRFSSLSRQPITRQISLLLGLAASIALGVGVVQWALTPEFAPLYGELPPESAAQIMQSLDTQNVPYRVDSRTGMVSVPADRVRATRLKLAGEGLPKLDTPGFAMLEEEYGLGVSSFMEKARYDRALEQELSSSITSLDSVRGARVHLALPKQSAFIRKKDKPAASVLVNLYPGRELSDRQLAGIVHLVAFSVPGLEAEQVSVIDNRGKLLSSQSDDDFGSTKENFRFTQQLEQRYVDRIREILTPILGVGAVQAQVAAEIDFTHIERTSEVYQPETSIRSEELVEETTEDRQSGGLPGTLANQPPAPAEVAAEAGGGGGAEQQAQRSSKREIRNYEVDRTISHIRETPGTLRKLSVAVVVDYQESVNAEGVVERVPLSDAELAEVKTLVQEAVGYDAERGDRVNVVNASFIPPPAMEPLPDASILDQPWVWQSVKLLLAGLTVLLTIFVVVRPLLKVSALPPPVAAPGNGAALGAPAGAMAMGDDRVSLGYAQQAGLPMGEPAYQQQLNMARMMAEGEPQQVANVVKKWVASDS